MRPLLRSLTRVGTGLAAMGAGAVLFWPDPVPPFDPEKALGFGTALLIWLYAEFFGADTGSADNAQETAPTLSEHDVAVGKRLYAMAGDSHITFLRQHDFGGSWRKEWADPIYDLAHELEKVAFEFNDQELQAQATRVRETSNALANHLAFAAGPIGSTDLFNMLPDVERASGITSAATNEKIARANQLADELAELLAQLFRLLRQRGVHLLTGT